MRNNDEMDVAIKSDLRFGEIAVKKGFINVFQVQKALSEQVSNEPSNRLRPQKLIGEILFEQGGMSQNQIETILQELANNKGQHSNTS